VQITGETLTIHLVDVPEVDAFTFPPALGNGITPVPLLPVKVSFDITYRKSGKPRHIRPESRDPLSPVNWAGEMWEATNSGTFSVAYDDGSFSASGSFDSSGNFGEMGMERNGSFVQPEDFGGESEEAQLNRSAPDVSEISASQNITHATMFRNAPRLKGRVLEPSR
jgi:hypothetical protein